jgi:Transposase DDE domain group 1
LTDDTTTQCWLFPELLSKKLVVCFDDERGSSDGGAVLLKAADERLRLTRALAACLRDERDPFRVTHGLDELVMQRVFAIACGYPDANDAAGLAEDPIHKLRLGRDPVDGQALASQPTLSRFENAVPRRQLFQLAEALALSVIERHRRRLRGRARRITIDLDQTADLAHGEQQLALFNGYYGNSCYLPLLGFVSFDDEAEQYLVTAVLRPGNAPDKRGGVAVLKRLFPVLRAAFPKARLRVRLDAGFASPEIFEFLEAQAVEYVVAMPKNPVLERRAEPHMREARRRAAEAGQTQHLYAETHYAARSWPHKRRVIIKAEVTDHPGREPKDNPRFVVTNLPQSPAFTYEHVYCRRGDVENRIKELHIGLEIDRTSCCRFLANQFRVLLTSAAFVLMQELRLRLARTSLARAQAWTLRDRLLKIGARIVASVRRLVLHLPASYPFRTPWGQLATSLGARPG